MGVGGDFVIAWTDFWSHLSAWSDSNVRVKLYGSDGVSRAGVLVNTYTPGSQLALSMAMDANGNFIVTWISIGQDTSGSGIYAQRYSAAGVPLGSEFRVNTVAIFDQVAPKVAMAGSSNFVITWAGELRDGSRLWRLCSGLRCSWHRAEYGSPRKHLHGR